MSTVPVPPPPPQDVTELPYGTVLKAGLGESMVIADMDFETYSEAGMYYVDGKWKGPPTASQSKKGLFAVGLQAYAEHPTTEVLCLAYNLKDGKGPRLWFPGLPNPVDLFDHIAQGKLVEAWNVGFEERIWNHVCVGKYGWPPLNTNILRCAMAKSRAYCLPGSLEKAGEVISPGAQKDKEGKRLLNKFSVPRNPTKNDKRLRIHPLEDADGPLLYSYCEQDIKAEAGISARVPDLTPREIEFWKVDQECNRRGMKLDMDAINAAMLQLDEQYEQAQEEIKRLTEGKVSSINQVQKITEWMRGQGVRTKSIDEDNILRLLNEAGTPDRVKQVLKLRLNTGSAAVKKIYAMKTQATSEGRVHDMFVYHGARTGRDTGAGVQPQNMPNGGPDCCMCKCGKYFSEEIGGPSPCCGIDRALCDPVEWDHTVADFALNELAKGSLGTYFPRMTEVLPGCVRGLLVADEGHNLIVSDYSAIEAVVAACLAKCQWRIGTFRRKDDIYLASVSAITGVPLEDYKEYFRKNGKHHPDRKKGKVAELASGYGGWTGAWRQFGAEDFFEGEEDLVNAIKAWRNASPEIVEAWGGQQKNWQTHLYGLEGAFVTSAQSEGVEIETGLPGVTYYNHRGTVYCRLPSGRYITYHGVSLRPDSKRPGKLAIHFRGWNSNPLMGPMGWAELNTYGGRLFENVVQAVARDIMAYAAVNLNKAGYKVCLRIHDEIGSQVPKGWGSVEEFETIANIMPPWAAGWPVSVSGGYRGRRFRK